MDMTETASAEPSDALHKYSEAVHAHIIGMPTALDLQISLFLVAQIGAVIFALKEFHEHHGAAFSHGAPDAGASAMLFGVALLGLGIFLCFYAIHYQVHKNHQNPFSLHGFAAHEDGQAMLAALKDRTPAQLLEDRLLHCREVAVVAVLKERWFHRASASGLLGVALVGIGVAVA
jgi:hypothetical protein